MDSPSSTPSAPLSRSTTMTSTHSETILATDNHDQPTIDNSLDDIFGSSPPASSNNFSSTTEAAAEPSELPSLRRQHVTAGYRDGITESKGQHVQNGFDAGFPVGAQLGIRAGTVLGILEGALRGYESQTGSAVVKKPVARGGSTDNAKESEAQAILRKEQREKVLKIYQRALKDLEVQSVFGVMEDNGDEEKPEQQLSRKGNSVISKWEDRARVAHWEKNMDALETKEAGKTENEGGDAERS